MSIFLGDESDDPHPQSFFPFTNDWFWCALLRQTPTQITINPLTVAIIAKTSALPHPVLWSQLRTGTVTEAMTTDNSTATSQLVFLQIFFHATKKPNPPRIRINPTVSIQSQQPLKYKAPNPVPMEICAANRYPQPQGCGQKINQRTKTNPAAAARPIERSTKKLPDPGIHKEISKQIAAKMERITKNHLETKHFPPSSVESVGGEVSPGPVEQPGTVSIVFGMGGQLPTLTVITYSCPGK